MPSHHPATAPVPAHQHELPAAAAELDPELDWARSLLLRQRRSARSTHASGVSLLDPSQPQGISTRCQVVLAKDPHLALVLANSPVPPVLTAVLEHAGADVHVQRALAGNPHAPSPVQAHLLLTGDVEVKMRVAAASSFHQVRELAVRFADPRVRTAVAGNPHASMGEVIALLRNPGRTSELEAAVRDRVSPHVAPQDLDLVMAALRVDCSSLGAALALVQELSSRMSAVQWEEFRARAGALGPLESLAVAADQHLNASAQPQLRTRARRPPVLAR